MDNKFVKSHFKNSSKAYNFINAKKNNNKAFVTMICSWIPHFIHFGKSIICYYYTIWIAIAYWIGIQLNNISYNFVPYFNSRSSEKLDEKKNKTKTNARARFAHIYQKLCHKHTGTYIRMKYSVFTRSYIHLFNKIIQHGLTPLDFDDRYGKIQYLAFELNFMYDRIFRNATWKDNQYRIIMCLIAKA